jgi:hypothetical protein
MIQKKVYHVHVLCDLSIQSCSQNIKFLHRHIQRLSPDGTFRDIVISKHVGVDRPHGITFNNDFTKLFIISGHATVLVYSCK